MSDQPEAPVRRGPALVTIVSSAPIRVINMRHGDRELHPNGESVLQANEEGHFIVGPNQSLKVEDAPNV